MARYHHQDIEKKWQNKWLEENTFAASDDTSKPKCYILDMFPYPSGAGLHVGHVTGYTGTDIYARYKRQKGFNVLHPMGWDSFGLPAEQYAIRTGTHPAVTTKKNIDTYRRQLQSVGFSYDWTREMATTDPDYYKWTQWIFTKLCEKELAYEKEMLVNFCPHLGTVLANEEVEDGKAKEGGYPVERRPLRQWVLKITEYAERLLQDLDDLDWPDHLKKLQRNWIGKSYGGTVHYKEATTGETISIYTTRPDTLFGATFLVISPEHPLVGKITTDECKTAVEQYQTESASKSDLERTELDKDKKGVFTGGFVECPLTGKKLPIWVSDYVLMSYGTGAVIGVPAHDDRDFQFAQKYNLEIICVVDPDFAGQDDHIPEGMTPDAMRSEILAGKRSWMGPGIAMNSKNSDLDLDGLDKKSAIKKFNAYTTEKGIGYASIKYKLRDWLFSRQRYWGEPMPVIHYEDGSTRILEESELPLLPPEIEDYKPSPTGESPLANVKEWVEITDPKTGKKARRETNTMPQWAGSCWYYLRFIDPKNGEKAWDSEKEKYWMPVDMYVGGVEHAVLHLLYARFWHKVLYDLGLASTKEPFQTLRNQGLVTANSYKREGGGYVDPHHVIKKDGKALEEGSENPLLVQVEKMSKSKLNGVTPDEIIEEYGADALRLYEMFMGPFDKEKLWNSDAVVGCRRFLNRIWEIVRSEKVVEKGDIKGVKLAHKLVAGVQEDIENMHYNTAIAKMMEFINHFEKCTDYPKQAVKMLVQCLNPFAPHITEEAWELLGETEPLAYTPFPTFDPEMLVDDTVTVAVQVNGKMRGAYEVAKGMAKDELLQFVKEQPKVAKHIGGEIVKEIVVPDKLVNIVVRV